MKKISQLIAKNRVLILIIAIILLIPSAIGYFNTKVNYDILSYLPNDLETREAQKILKDEFDCGSLAMLIVEGMDNKDVAKLKEKVEVVDGVSEVIWINDALDISVPKEILPDLVKNIFFSDNSTMMIVKLRDTDASESTEKAIEEIRKITGKQAFLSGVAGVIKDTKDLADKETPIYVLIAVILSFIIPIIFMLSIGVAIIYNMGTNIVFGNISYITKALSAVLQLGVTMDYSIFLLHRYDEERKNQLNKIDAMSVAIEKTISSITGSSLTTIAGFLALCIMDLALGKDIGLVMAKGVLFGVICTVTVLPSMILVFDKLIHKYQHKVLLPKFEKSSEFIIKHHKVLVAIAAIILIPAIIGNNNTKVYYNLDESLPKDLLSIVANDKLKTEYNMMSTNIILVKDDLEGYKINQMIEELKNIDGVTSVVGLEGEAPLTEDLITIADNDFKKVNTASILAIFIIILFVFKSISVPILLVLAIELAIFINLGIPYYTGSVIPFVSSIVIGTIQLGATVDYAILLTSRFQEELALTNNKVKAMTIALKTSSRSIVTSALTFFAATAGVGIISDIEMISSLCILMSRGAIISMFVILFVLPGILLLCEKLIIKTSKSFVKSTEGVK